MKLPTTKRLTTLLWALVLMLMPMSVMADDNTPLSVTVKNHSGGYVSNEWADMAFDGITTTKWCGNIPTPTGINPFVEVELTQSSKLDYYYLYTGNDINYENEEGKQQRNPKEWKLFAKVNASDEWTEISHVTDAQLPTTLSTRSKNYRIDAAYQNIQYKYLKFEILQVEQGDIFEVGEICLINCVNHSGELVAEEPATCTKPGRKAYRDCPDCGRRVDVNGNELAEGEWVRPMIEHNFDTDDICTLCGYVKQYPLSFSIEESLGGNDKEGPEKAIDGITTNKWCGFFSKGNPYIVLKHDGITKLDHYYLYTGNDILNAGTNRNPKEWKLYAKRKAKDAWTEISHVTNAQLPTEYSTKSNDYAITEEFKNTYYKFFKFEIIGVEKGSTYEVGELCLMGRVCSHEYNEGSAICTGCGEIKEHEHSFENGICTQCGDWQPFPLSFNIVRAVPAENVNETADKAFDGITTNKWCGEISNGHPYVLLRHDCKARMKHYNLYTGNDIHHHQVPYVDEERNPREWKLYAKENANDPWTVISHVTDAQLPTTVSTLSQDYLIDEAYQDKYYKFFMFEVINHEPQKDGASHFFEIGELSFFGLACSHEFDANDVCTACGTEKTHQHNYVNGICTKCEDYEPVGGEGTEASPYLIGNAGQLAWFRDQTRNGRHDICAKLTADIDMAPVCGETVVSWMAIDNFAGIFDGDGHVLNNLYINDQYWYTGLFNWNTGLIKNLGIESGSIKTSNFTVGAICAFNYAEDGRVGRIINCFNKVPVSSTYNVNMNPDVGGICGENRGGIIERCYNTGDVSGRNFVAGICASSGNGIITDCYNTGTVSAEWNHAGGIVGYLFDNTESTNRTFVKNCYNIGEVKETTKMPSHGIVGTVGGGSVNITNNYYLEGTRPDDNAAALTADQFSSGEAAWLLNGSIDNEGKWASGKTDGTQSWYQKLGADAYPVLLKAEGNTVFSDCTNSTKAYSNSGEGIVIHVFGEFVPRKDATCTEAGYKAYHVCENCNRYFDEDYNLLAEDEWVIPALGHTFNDDLKCTACGHEIGADCIIEYTATQRLRYEEEYSEEVFDYTDEVGTENLGYHLFGAEAILHEYDETTQKGRIVFSTPVERFYEYTELHHEYLTSITLPSTVKYISGYAFYECRNLTTITLRAEDVKSTNYLIPPYECNNLREIFVPYISYNEYMEKYGYSAASYEDEDGEDQYVYIRDILKSLLTLDDTQAFQSPTNEVKVDATLQRSFANDGWYSLCLPFSVSVADSPFAQVAEFSELDGDTYRFTTVDNIEAGKAYIVKVNEAVANPTFKNVMISTAAPATDGEFIGVYSPTELGEGCKVIGSGTTVNPVNPGMMKGYRAYFPASAANTKAMRFTVDDGEATVIQSLIEAEGYKLKATGAYNLAGQKVNENYRGIVIKDGVKVMKK